MPISEKRDYYLAVLLILSLIFVVCLVAFGNSKYASYLSGYFDFGSAIYTFYWHVHGLQYYTNPLQYLVFMNHISFFAILLVPVFALYQQPVTLFLIQDFALAATIMLLYLVAADLLKSRRIAFAFAIALMVNPEIFGLGIFDFHFEAFTVFFYLLSFYFYMKRSFWKFALSFAFLLSVMEFDSLVGLSMVSALLVYEVFYNKGFGDKTVRRMLIAGLILGLVALTSYFALEIYLPGTYTGGALQNVVPLQQPISYFMAQFHSLTSQKVGNTIPTLLYAGTMGVLLLSMGFGVSSFLVPAVSILLYSPWWAEFLLTHSAALFYPYNQYYSFALGGGVASALLGILRLTKERFLFNKNSWREKKFEYFIATNVMLFGAGISLLVFMIAGPSLNLGGRGQISNYTAINYAVNLIPKNATVLTQSTIAPHLFKVHNLELSNGEHVVPEGLSYYWAPPDYIILNKQLEYYSQIINATPFNQSNFSGEYSLYFNQSGILIYKRVR